MRGLENYIPDPTQLLPSHLYHELLFGETTDTHEPVTIKTISGRETEHDNQIATSFLQAEHNLTFSFSHSPQILRDTAFYSGAAPTNVKLRERTEVPSVGILCIGYIGVLREVVKYPVPVSLCLKYAINICEALVEVHQRMLVHRNINPTAIVMHENGEAHLNGFHLSYNCLTDSSFEVNILIKELTTNNDTHKVTPVFSDTECLKYISPEHTGRVHNKPDPRSDLYCLGVLMYEMLTGTLPFSYSDPLEMMHAHIARPPPPLPAHLSSLGEIVHILLAKDPDQRYSTPLGLKADLITCKDMIFKYGHIKLFPLRKQDLIANPRLFGGLLGRQKEVALITNVINKIHESSSVLFISGSAGVGKTALVNALLKDIQEKGMYGTGKFDEYIATTKFFGVITSSIKNLFSQSISRSNSDISEWKKKLLQVIAGCEKIFLDMFPQMEMYVETPVDAEQLPPIERKYRMHTMIADLVAMLSSIAPIILFFDDLQWADPASLELIEVISNASETNILIIGTYREFNPELKARVESIKASKREKCACLDLQPFDENAVLDLLCESLQDDREHLKDLAKVIHSKTMGNTLFVVQFLAILYRRALVYFDWDLQKWVWDMDKIEQIGYTDGLVTFFRNIFHDLQAESLNLLSFASLLGNKFNVKVVSHFAQMFNFPGVAAALIEATKTGFIVYLGKDEYSFIHDKIRQSAYELSSDKLKQRVYYQVGIYLLNSDDEDSSVSSLVYLKHVYLQLLAKSDSEEGKKNLSKATTLALKAGIASKMASAYPSALDYLQLGCNMLLPKDWEQDNTVAYTLTLAHAECMFLCGFQEEALREFSRLLDLPLTISQKVRVYQTEMHVLSSTVNYSEGIKVGLACCSLLGFEVRDEEKNIQACDKLIKSMDLQTVFNMPTLADTNLSLLMDMMGSLIMVAFFADKSLFMLVASEMVRITLSHGPSPSCPTGLVFFASYYGTVFSEPIKAYHLGKLAVDLHQRFPVNSVKSKAQFLFTFVNPWQNHFSDNFRYLRSALQAAQAAGDYLYKGYATGHIPNTMLWVGSHAREILAEARGLNKNLQKKEKYKDILLLCDIAVGFASLLLGETISEDSFSTLDGTVNEEDYLLDKKNGVLVDNWFQGVKIEALYLFGLYKEANELSIHYLNIVGSLVGHPHEPRGVSYSILSFLAAFPSGTEEYSNSPTQDEREELLEKVTKLRKHTEVWVKYSSQNFLHYDLLIDAEIARVKGDVQIALMLYDRAAAQARSNSYFYIEALAHELATRVLDEVGMVSFAELSVKKALEGYSNWGAVQKVKQLTRKYSHLLPSYVVPEHLIGPCAPNADEEVLHAKTRELDMRTIIKANHVLSKEIALPQLLQKFVNIVLENVGAEQAAIVLVQNSSWSVASSWSVHDQHSKKQTAMSMEGARKNIVDYVLHTKRPLAIDAFKKSDFYDPLQGMEIGSVLCVPIGLKGLVCGAVYLEHTVPRVLQQDRLELMSLLCTQLYISIDNANLYNSIQSSEHRYKTMAEGLPIMAFSRNSSGGTFANSKLLQFFGMASDRAESVALDDVVARIHPEDAEIFMDAWNSAVDPTSSPVEVEMRVRRASDGDFRWTLCHVTPCFDSLNRAETLMGTWMDIQELKDAQAEQIHKAEIEASEQKYRSLAEAIPQIVWKSPQDGQVNYFNKRWYDYTGLTEAESLGTGYMVSFHPEDVQVWPLHLEMNDDFEVKLRIRRKDGVYRWHLARGIFAAGKKFGTFTDIEDQAQTEASLEIARKTAEKAAHNQAFFVANMSHEIRTPMNGLLGMLHLLLETNLSEEQRDYADTMKRSADSLLRIIDDVLDFSKIQEGKLELRDELIGVEAILEDVIETLSILAVSVELIFSVHRDVPAKLIGDSGKLRQVIMNLVGNSVKFTPSGGVIFVSCVVKEWQGENVLLKFEVSDTGEGIGLEKQKMLFTPFYQADSSSTRTHGGTGLGLAICKQLVTLFHGEISVKSTKGKGSLFTFTARFKIAPEQPAPPPPFPAHWRALLVSNLPLSLAMLENHLQTCKIEYLTATSQEAAIAILRAEKEQQQKEQRATPSGISCVILDLFSHLEMDAEFQKFKPYLERKHVVLVVSSLQRPKLIREFSEASFLLKPVTLHKFVEALLDRSTQSKGKLTLSSDKFQYKGTSQVLVVEDNKVNQKVLASFLTKYHVPFSMANNGLEAFQMVKEKPFGYFSLILLDLAMPIWDGYRACTEIRNLENGAYRHPIVALTANVQDGILDNCRACGMDDFISKPVDFKQLFAMLDKYLCEEPN